MNKSNHQEERTKFSCFTIPQLVKIIDFEKLRDFSNKKPKEEEKVITNMKFQPSSKKNQLNQIKVLLKLLTLYFICHSNQVSNLTNRQNLLKRLVLKFQNLIHRN